MVNKFFILDSKIYSHFKNITVEVLEEHENGICSVVVVKNKKFNIRPKKVIDINNSTFRAKYDTDFLKGFLFDIHKSNLKILEGSDLW